MRLCIKWARMYLNIINKGSTHKCKAKPIKYLEESKAGCHSLWEYELIFSRYQVKH